MVTAAVPPTPSADRDAWLARLRDAIRRGEYRVDPGAVADAALRHDAFRRQLLS
jgi:anti-sigma28 factor (negative regulator of flagellin synthesis)